MDYDIGDTIEYTPFGGGTRVVLVDDHSDDIKNGRPGFDGRLVEGGGILGMPVWGYDDQITRVIR